jgi:hypothetical protein
MDWLNHFDGILVHINLKDRRDRPGVEDVLKLAAR